MRNQKQRKTNLLNLSTLESKYKQEGRKNDQLRNRNIFYKKYWLLFLICMFVCLNNIYIMQGEDIRFIENPFKKIYNIIQPDHDKLYKILFANIEEFLAGSKLPTLQAIASDPAKT